MAEKGDWKRQFEIELDKRVRAAAVLLQGEHKRDLSKMNPAPHRTPSVPGQYPKARTLNLRNAVSVQKIKSCVYRVGYLKSAWYILPLMKMKRKTVRDTAGRIKERLKRIIRSA